MISKDERARIEALAEKYVKKEKFQDAIDEYIKLLTGDEQDISIRNIIGDLYLKSGKKNKAVEELKKIAIYYGEKELYSKSIAIYKRITRLDPDDYDSARKLADFYCDRGFISEAKTEYRKLAQNLKKNNKSKKAISTYEKLLKLDSSDIESRLSLAELYTKEKLIDQAVEELNEVAEFKMHTKEFKEAEDILNKAKALKGDHSRTLANLIDLLKRKNKKKEALDLVSEILQKDKDNIKALYLLGNLYYEDKGFKEAEEIFSRIISIRPKEVEARVKLGRIYIKKGNFNQVFELYEPLVDTLIRKQKEEKAIGLLGLILAARRDHLSTLEKLASIYEIKGQKKNLEIVYKVVLEEYKKKNLKEKSFSILGELLNICPEVEEYHIQYKELRNELGVSDEAAGEDQPLVIVGEKNKVIEANLAKADLYIEQGLIRNAKRMLENLRLKFPENLKIGQKIDKLKSISSRVKEEEIIKRVEKVSEKETELFGEVSEAANRGLSRRSQEEQMEEKLTAADVFAETDIIPLVYREVSVRKYFDLTEKIDEELEAIKVIFHQQLNGDTASIEKELTDIVSEFRKTVEEKVDKADHESRYNLGVAFMEQELTDEAIEEFKLASQDEKLEVECYSSISLCYRRKGDFQEALKWIEKAQKLSEKESIQFFALKYELASIYEEMNERKKALKVYKEVKEWNAGYRDVNKKIKSLEEKPSK